jgi:hypothetical protein
MSDLRLAYPMFALVLLTLNVLLVLFRRRVRAVREGKVTRRFFRIYQAEVEPDYSAQASRHFSNLFEAPTLFYAGCLTAMLAHDNALWVLGLAWIYVAARVAHAYIHLGSNRLQGRVGVYFAGWLALMAIWVHVVLHVAMSR